MSAVHNGALLVVVACVFAALALSGFWCILKAAAIARRRTRIALDRLPLLWQTIGAAGHPPRDHSRQFAIVYAVIRLVVAWIVVPVAIAIAYGPLSRR